MLLRRGMLDPCEIADAVADFGVEYFVEAKPDVEQLLDHDDPIVRYSAIVALGFDFCTTDRIERLLDILFRDPDRDCRRAAAAAFGCLHRGTNDKRIAGALAVVVRNKNEEDDVRIFAYTALLNVLGIPRNLQPDPLSMALGDIDWELVRGYSAL